MNNSPKSNVAGLKRALISLSLVAMLLIASIAFVYFCNFDGPFSKDHNAWGTFGDFVGGSLNPLLGFFSFIALLFTIYIQSQELEATRKEIKESSDALKDQSKSLERQSFERTFFSLLEEHNKAMARLNEINTNDVRKRTRLKWLHDYVFDATDDSLPDCRDRLMEHNEVCGTYFRVLYQLLKFVVSSHPETREHYKPNISIENLPLSTDEKMYSNMVRAFLSNELLQLLMVNSGCRDSSHPFWKYRLLIERYSFLEHMPWSYGGEPISSINQVTEYFGESAFGDNENLPRNVA